MSRKVLLRLPSIRPSSSSRRRRSDRARPRLHAAGPSVAAASGLSLRWFRADLDYPEFVRAFGQSLWLVAASTVIASARPPCGARHRRDRFPGCGAISALFMSALTVLLVVLGIAFLRSFTTIGLSGTSIGLVASHVIIVTPFALRLALAGSDGIDQRIEHAAASLGAGAATVFRRVTLSSCPAWRRLHAGLYYLVRSGNDHRVYRLAQDRDAASQAFLYIQDNIDPTVASTRPVSLPRRPWR